MILVGVLNHSTVVPEPELSKVVAALQIQVSQHFYPAWGINAMLTHYLAGHAPPASSWQLGVFDDADQADALGYHDLTATGLPLAKVFARTTQADNASVSVVCSHELLEMLADPWINVLIQDYQDATKFWIREVGDPVEADADGYEINGTLMSNFVLPAYFEPDLSLGMPYDYRKLLGAPLPALRPGGYLSFVQGGQWSQIFASEPRTPGKVGGSGRILRRMRGGETWRRSTAAGAVAG